MATAKLFLHGVPDSPAIWRPLLAALDLGDTPVAVPALPGFTAPLPAGFVPFLQLQRPQILRTMLLILKRYGCRPSPHARPVPGGLPWDSP